MFGPKEIHCSQQCCVSLSSDMTRCIIREEVHTPAVPYGDSFSCVSYTDVRSAPGDAQGCIASITAYVAFSKQPNYLISGKIVSEAHKDYSEAAAMWKNMALSHCRDSAAMLSDFRALTSARAPSAKVLHNDGRDASSLQQLSARLSRALSRTASTDSISSNSRRNSATGNAGHDRFRTSRQGSFAQDSPNDNVSSSIIGTSSHAISGDGSLFFRSDEPRYHVSGAWRAETAPAASGAMSNSKLMLRLRERTIAVLLAVVQAFFLGHGRRCNWSLVNPSMFLCSHTLLAFQFCPTCLSFFRRQQRLQLRYSVTSSCCWCVCPFHLHSNATFKL